MRIVRGTEPTLGAILLLATLAATTAIAATALPRRAAAPDAPAPPGSLAKGHRGWHGEILPAGLEKSRKPQEYIWKKDGSIMVYVPAGVFRMGSEQGAPNERPVHEVDLDAYYIDKYEVSWKQWKASGLFYATRITGRLDRVEPPDWGIVDDQPVLNVTWSEARQYAERAGKRLPTEAEWEKAARGTDGREYPWGNAPPTFDRAVWREHPISGKSDAPVTCCAAGASPYGVFNMAGNVMEWCEDIYDPHFYAKSPRKNPVCRGAGDYRIIRGGAFLLEKDMLRAADRYRLHEYERQPYLGFRTVVSGIDAKP